jgi:hypothetical protein
MGIAGFSFCAMGEKEALEIGVFYDRAYWA